MSLSPRISTLSIRHFINRLRNADGKEDQFPGRPAINSLTIWKSGSAGPDCADCLEFSSSICFCISRIVLQYKASFSLSTWPVVSSTQEASSDFHFKRSCSSLVISCLFLETFNRPSFTSDSILNNTFSPWAVICNWLRTALSRGSSRKCLEISRQIEPLPAA